MFVDCCRTGYCCGNGRDSAIGDWEYIDEPVPAGVGVVEKDGRFLLPVDENGVCVYLVKHNNGFCSCGIHDRKPKMCALYNCLTAKKIKYIGAIVEELKGRCD